MRVDSLVERHQQLGMHSQNGTVAVQWVNATATATVSVRVCDDHCVAVAETLQDAAKAANAWGQP